jgi:hypothetical protein
LFGDALTWLGLALLAFELAGKDSGVVLSQEYPDHYPYSPYYVSLAPLMLLWAIAGIGQVLVNLPTQNNQSFLYGSLIGFVLFVGVQLYLSPSV